MHSVKKITQVSGTLSRKSKLSIEKVTQILKYGILMGQIMEAAIVREVWDLQSISPWERAEREKKK